MSENGRLPIIERWATRYDQSVRINQGIFTSYDQSSVRQNSEGKTCQI